MRRIVLLLTTIAAALLLVCGVALAALPSEKPDQTPMVDGRVRAIEQVGTNVWVGGRFSEIEQPKGPKEVAVSNVAVFNSVTDRYVPIALKLGGKGSEVWDMTLYGGDVLIAGEFSGPSSEEKNLVRVDGESGKIIKWFDSPELKSVLAAPNLGRVYGGGRSLSAFEFARGKKRPLWTQAETSVDPSLRPHDSKAAYRDLELDADGETIWAACVCDAVNDNPAKALVKLSTEGVHDTSWLAEAGEGAFGHSVVDQSRKLYLAAGGSDFLAEVSKTTGKRNWVRDTSGSTQAVAVLDGQLVIGGHFWEVAADRAGDKCGSGQGSSNPKLDPHDECHTRKGIAAYSFSGRLDPNWSPEYSGSYSLVWELHAEGSSLHTGGQFKEVSGVTQSSYARLSPASL
jgi:hypothetical protein